jgi:transposase
MSRRKAKTNKKPSVTNELRYEKRRGVVEAVQRGNAPKNVARIYHIPITCVYDWLARYRDGGWQSLRDRKRSGRPRKISGVTIKWLYDAITLGDPSQYQFEFCLWTLKIIKDMLKQRFGITVSKSSVCRLLAQMGLSPQRPVFTAVQKDPKAVDRYLKREYPHIREQARRIGAEILFVDEAAFRSDHHSGTTWAPIGKTPIVNESRGRFGYKAITAVSARGKMYFQTFSGSMNAAGFIPFLKKLRKDVGKPIVVILDCASYHRAKVVTEYAKSTNGEVTLEYLPARAPELNPSEQVWNRAKERMGRMIIKDAEDMKNCLRKVLRSVQGRADLVRSFFKLKDTRYAAT